MSELIDSLIPTLKEGFLFEPIPEGCLLLEETTGKLITLNAAAEAVLTLCDGQLCVGEICSTAQSEFQIPSSESLEALARLKGTGVLIVPSTDESTAAS